MKIGELTHSIVTMWYKARIFFSGILLSFNDQENKDIKDQENNDQENENEGTLCANSLLWYLGHFTHPRPCYTKKGTVTFPFCRVPFMDSFNCCIKAEVFQLLKNLMYLCFLFINFGHNLYNWYNLWNLLSTLLTSLFYSPLCKPVR